MIRSIVLTLCMALLPFPGLAAETLPSSLFFTDEAIADIHAATIRDDVRNLHLDAIAFYSAQRWTLWIQGKAWTPADVSKDFTILAVTPSSVTMKLHRDGEEPRTLTLKTGQSWLAARNEIIEGNPPPPRSGGAP